MCHSFKTMWKASATAMRPQSSRLSATPSTSSLAYRMGYGLRGDGLEGVTTLKAKKKLSDMRQKLGEWWMCMCIKYTRFSRLWNVWKYMHKCGQRCSEGLLGRCARGEGLSTSRSPCPIWFLCVALLLYTIVCGLLLFLVLTIEFFIN